MLSSFLPGDMLRYYLVDNIAGTEAIPKLIAEIVL